MKPMFALAVLAAFALAACTVSAPVAPAAPAAPDTRAAPAAPAAPAKPTAVPAAFIGEWNSDPKACSTGQNESRLRIGADRIDFYESGGPITAVTLKSPTEVAITATLSGEGETWTDVTSFRLSADGKTLTDASVPGEESPTSRTRCP